MQKRILIIFNIKKIISDLKESLNKLRTSSGAHLIDFINRCEARVGNSESFEFACSSRMMESFDYMNNPSYTVYFESVELIDDLSKLPELNSIWNQIIDKIIESSNVYFQESDYDFYEFFEPENLNSLSIQAMTDGATKVLLKEKFRRIKEFLQLDADVEQMTDIFWTS